MKAIQRVHHSRTVGSQKFEVRLQYYHAPIVEAQPEVKPRSKGARRRFSWCVLLLIILAGMLATAALIWKLGDSVTVSSPSEMRL